MSDAVLPVATTKIAPGIEYDGSRYYGWQRQQEVRSVQEKLEKALSKVANHPVVVFCAGRTDAGVHGTGQWFILKRPPCGKTPHGRWGERQLPDDIAVRWVKTVSDDFHARFSATARRYRYVIYNRRLRPAILHGGVTHFYHPLDAEKMARAGSACWAKMTLPRFAPCSASRARRGAM